MLSKETKKNHRLAAIDGLKILIPILIGFILFLYHYYSKVLSDYPNILNLLFLTVFLVLFGLIMFLLIIVIKFANEDL